MSAQGRGSSLGCFPLLWQMLTWSQVSLQYIVASSLWADMGSRAGEKVGNVHIR